MADKQDAGKAIAQSTAMAGKLIAEELRLCVEESQRTWSKVSSFLTNHVGGTFLMTALCMVALPWLWLQSLNLFLYILRTLNIKQGQERLKQAITKDGALKELIEQLVAEKDEEKDAKEEKEKERQTVMEEVNHTHSGDQSEITALPTKPSPRISLPCLEAPVVITIPTSKGRQECEHEASKKLVVDRFKGQGYHIMKSKVELNREAMGNLHDLVDEFSKINNKFTVQLSRWRILVCIADGVKKLKLDDTHQVPTILHAAYAAGKLTIQGLNLVGADIKATTFNKCITLKDFTKEEVVGGLQVWTSIVRLPSNNLGEVFVFATKSILVDDHKDIIVCSSIVNVQDENLRTVLRVGVPSTIGLIYMMTGLIFLQGWHFVPLAFVWILPLIVMALTQLLPQSTENAIERFFERIGLAISTLYTATWSLFNKQDPKLASSRIGHKRCNRVSQKGNSHDLDDSTKQDKPLQHKEQKELNNVEDDGETGYVVVVDDDDDDDDDDEYRRPPRHPAFNIISKRPGSMVREEKKIKKITPKGDGSEKKNSPKDEEPQCFAYEEYKDDFGRLNVRKRDYKSIDNEAKNLLPFKFIYGHKDKPMWYERDYFKIYSPTVIQVLHKKLPEKIQLLGSDKIKIFVSDMFPKQDILKKTMDLGEDLPSTKSDIAKLRSHLKHMWGFLDTSLQEIVGRYKAMESEGCVSWDMLWAFFSPGTKVEYRCKVTGTKLCGKVQTTKYMYSHGRPPSFVIFIEVWDYNCQAWQSYPIQRGINQYAGGSKFTCLATHPLRFKGDFVEAEEKFLENGAWFGKLSMKTRNRFMHYKGLMYVGNVHNKEAVNGRVMIDLSSFAKMKPDHPMESATPPSEILRTNQVEAIDISTDENRKYAPAIVYGFSFQTKMWGTFDICGFEEVIFNQLAFDALVINQAKKDIIYGLVQKYERNQDEGQCESQDGEQVDPIVGKGSGCIFLCYGPPGTGKTFTAESTSEKLKAPLWSLSVSELGTTPKKLEEKLVKVLDVAASWGAILLLDEADIYMEKRTSIDLERNAMTGIFLRNLEYYRGVLFLTTNRVVAFDDAFCSRISMFLYYGKHSPDDRQTIWRNLLEPLKLQDLPDDMFGNFASYELNAREIRNVVQVARTLAKRNRESLDGTYLMQSLVTLAASLEELKRVTSESNAHTSMIESRWRKLKEDKEDDEEGKEEEEEREDDFQAQRKKREKKNFGCRK